jgi:outer membrane immunogenic protein
MKRFLGLAIVTLSFLGGTNAMAADMAARAPVYKAPPPVEIDSWTGFYAGFNGGAVWGRDHLTAAPADAGTTAFWAACNAAGACPFDYGRGTGVSGEFGGQLGYNWQIGTVVYGIETDLQWTDVKSSASVALANTTTGFVPFAGTESARLDWFGTTRGRVGFLVQPNVLLYGTGGVAYGSVSNSWNATFAPPANQVVNGSSRDTRIGWVAGAGVDWKVTRNWIVGLEYLHTELESNSFGATGFGSAGCSATNCNFNINAGSFKTDTVRARFSYQFGGPVVARY